MHSKRDKKDTLQKSPVKPTERHETVRQLITEFLSEGRACTAKELSGLCSITEKEVYDHLEHIRISLEHSGKCFKIDQARCRLCGFEFTQRTRLKKPGKCPACKGTSIEAPFFSI